MGFEAEIAAVLERHGLSLSDARERVETYRVVDRTGALRGQGLKEWQAASLADRLVQDPGVAPVEIVRVLHWSFTQVSVARVVGEAAAVADE